MKIFDKLCAFVSSGVGLIIANSVSGLKDLQERGYRGLRSVVVYHGIDSEKYQYNVLLREEMRNRLKVLDNQILIGIVGRLDPMKDHYTFFRAASHIVKHHYN